MRKLPSIALLLSLISIGCGSDAVGPGMPQGMPDMAMPPATNSPVALFEVKAAPTDQKVPRTPWPSDLFLDSQGHVALTSLPFDFSLSDTLLSDLNTLQDGFSVGSGAYFPVSGTINPDTLVGHVHLYDLDNGTEYGVKVAYRSDAASIYVRPSNGGTLLERHRYAYVVTRDVGGSTGKLVPSSHMAALLAAKSAPAVPLDRAYALYQPFFKLLDQGKLAGISRDNIAVATVFTTHSITASLVSMRKALSATAAPVATSRMVFASTVQAGDSGSLDTLLGTPSRDQPGFDNPGGVSHGNLAFVIQGTYKSSDYLNDAQPVNALGATPSAVSVFVGEPNAPTPKSELVVPFTLALPKGNLTNLPVVIFQHGIGADRSVTMAVANSFAAKGIATIGIDIPFHGARYPMAVDTKFNFTGANGPDGFAESDGRAFLYFFDASGGDGVSMLQPSAVRAAFMQASIDIMQAVRLVTGGDFSSLGAADARLKTLSFRKDKIAYGGESFGAMIGTLVSAIDPQIGASVIDVGGGGLMYPLLSTSAAFAPQLLPALSLLLGIVTDDPANPVDTDFVVNLAQGLLEGCDPSAYGPYVALHPVEGNKPKHVLQTSAHLDEVVPNEANESLARSMGLSPVNVQNGSVDLKFWPTPPMTLTAPVAGNLHLGEQSVTAAFVQFDQAAHTMMSGRNGQHTVDQSQPFPYPMLPAAVKFVGPIDQLQRLVTNFYNDYFTTNAAPNILAN